MTSNNQFPHFQHGLSNFTDIDGLLGINGKPFTHYLKDDDDQQPVYIFSKTCINDKISQLRDNFPASTKFYYSLKANPNKEVLKLIAEKLDGFETSSMGEMKPITDLNKPELRTCLTGPGKSIAELTYAINHDAFINVESINELQTVSKICGKLNKKTNITLRINPHYIVSYSGVKMSGGSTQFGIDEELIPSVIRQIDTSKINLKGFHIYFGTQNLSTDAICEAHWKAAILFKQLISSLDLNLDHLNFGGGFGIPYFPYHTPLDINKIGKNFRLVQDDIWKSYPQIELALELGRYIVGEAGVYICKILDKKVSRGVTYLVTNGGLHHHLAASGNLGQKVKKNFPIVNASNVNSSNTEVVTIVGRLCTTLDIIAEEIEIPKADVGDYIAILQSGAYGKTASPNDFLSHAAPKEILV